MHASQILSWASIIQVSLLSLGLLACAARSPTAEPAAEPADEPAVEPEVPAWSVPEGLPAGQLTCTSPEHPSLRYEGWRKSGGPPPEPSSPMSGESWLWDEVILYASQRLYSGEETISGALSWSWQHDAAALIEQAQQGMGRSTVYTTAVSLSMPSGEPLAVGLEPALTASLTCTRKEVWGVP